jgi:2-oxoglutarate dehydrogenase E1 component
MSAKSYITNADVNYIDDLYKQYKTDQASVDFGWQKFFEGFELGQGKDFSGEVSEEALKEIQVLNLINDYRKRGHLFTKTNPVRERRKYEPPLNIEQYGLEKADLPKVFNAGLEVGLGSASLQAIINHLENTYCHSIGVEYTYIRDVERVKWLKNIFEQTQNKPNLTIKEKTRLFERLNQATVFENFLHVKYIGQKRFSLEGLECLIPALDSVIHYGAELGVEEFVMGMAHRGRLNVLVNIFQKTYEEVFSEFEGKVFQDDKPYLEGDVKYHMGYSSKIVTDTGKHVHLSLAPNPSHLESVDPVVKGAVRAKLDHKYQGDFNKICPILIHGDAAIAGQGIVYEIVQMSGLEANRVGGTIHIVTNNQIGFTTNYLDARTSTYCTDVAKVTHCPVLHVNGDDVEAVVHAIKVAMSYRNQFNSDIFIDLLGYRKYGHNEGDEPRFTQPLLYKTIAKHPNPREIYKAHLLNRGEIDAHLANDMELRFKALLQEKLDIARSLESPRKPETPEGIVNYWTHFVVPAAADFEKTADTTFDTQQWLTLAQKITTLPQDHLPIRKVQQLFEQRAKMISDNKFDWAMGELMAYATLLSEGHHVRLTGQDCERGTFSHRHAVIKKEDSEIEFIPLQHLSTEQGNFFVYNSLLSEYAALGFEYGYASATPETLTLWEAQFGDFANGAQIIIDQYIAAGLAKWGRHNGLVMLLPHGYEGQGPEHSSARPERFLQLAANFNMQVVNCSTPANIYHVLRRQLKRNFRVPLIIMTPKSLLRHPKCTSTLEAFTQGGFQEVYADETASQQSKKVLFCTGKIYYELLEKQQSEQHSQVAIYRIEQLYPLPERQIAEIIASHPHASFHWVQEEPKNMGYWMHMLRYELMRNFEYIGRKSSASPATGLKNLHEKEQSDILNKAFELK